ncbi:hypothetical protein B296_00037939 [Ensete ventricosum]|uniref:Uncharacterized protein n=1 Tax=Ensete ventricosum TaxID=4639 RepID=A0A426X5M5_ENSVE|nr:hypothetical protein B296_00037939 [Ensete ventricosum]
MCRLSELMKQLFEKALPLYKSEQAFNLDWTAHSFPLIFFINYELIRIFLFSL